MQIEIKLSLFVIIFIFTEWSPKICREEEEVSVNYVLGETSNHIGYGEAKTGKLDMKL